MLIARIYVLYYNLKSEFLLNCDKYNMSIEEATRCENESKLQQIMEVISRQKDE